MRVQNMLRLEDVHVHFTLRRGLFQRGVVRAVNGVSLSIAAREIVALVGESGSGKTTLGRVSLRLERPTQGRAWFNQKEISQAGESALREFRRRAQAVFQDPYSSINPYMTVAQIVEEPLIIHKIGSRAERSAQVEALLEALRLHPIREFVQKFPHQMSGGQRQRVALARALILNPDYLMADEPVSMIDASSRAEILQLMQEQQRERGMAVLYITHDIATARHYAHRIGVMYLGSLAELGPSRRIIDHPLHPYTQHLIEAVPEPDPANRHRQRQVVPGEPPSPIHLPKGCFFHPRCPKFMKGLCDAARPALKEVEPGHSVACYLYHRDSLKDSETKQVAAHA